MGTDRDAEDAASSTHRLGTAQRRTPVTATGIDFHLTKFRLSRSFFPGSGSRADALVVQTEQIDGGLLVGMGPPKRLKDGVDAVVRHDQFNPVLRQPLFLVPRSDEGSRAFERVEAAFAPDDWATSTISVWSAGTNVTRAYMPHLAFRARALMRT